MLARFVRLRFFLTRVAFGGWPVAFIALPPRFRQFCGQVPGSVVSLPDKEKTLIES
jgi:hypothetical protein